MTKTSRILILLGALALGLMYVLPLWTIKLEAPQYPEGLGMVIEIDNIRGVKEHDLDNINNLNHYIGMKRIEPESIPELRVMPVVVGFLMALGVLVALLGRRPLLYTWTGVFLVVSLAGMADFWKWEYDYGHDLDNEQAIIKVPGMSYQPPLIGSRQILNFKAHSWPGGGGWIAILVATMATGITFLEFRRARSQGGGPDDGGRAQDGEGNRTGGSGVAAGGAGAASLALLLIGALATQACADPQPRPIVLGVDQCAHCLMTVADEGHAAEAVTTTGKVYTLDSVECLVAFIHHDISPEEKIASLWVTDFANRPTLVRAEDAFYLKSPTLPSPMGLGLTAFAREQDRDGAVNSLGGEPLDWAEVQRVVEEAWPGGRPPVAHGGHGEMMMPDEGGSPDSVQGAKM
ncbi:MAG: nitrous oxide reductase accessory protein NosL [Gemmatimonadota bacterium]